MLVPKNCEHKSCRGYKYCRRTYLRSYWRNHAKQASAHCRKSQLKTLYGLTPESYDLLLKEQKGRCAICGNRLARNTENPFEVFDKILQEMAD